MTEKHIQNVRCLYQLSYFHLLDKEGVEETPEGEDRMKGGLDLKLCGVNVCS